MKPYEEMMLRFFGGTDYDTSVGFISWFAARSISEDAIEMSWIVDMSTRYHELTVSLPRSEFVACVGCWQASERPRVFVTDTWLDHIHLRNYSIFALVDAIGVKVRIRKGTLTTDSLLGLRTCIDELASRHPEASFVSFGDSLLIHSRQVKARMPDSTGDFRVRLSRATCLGDRCGKLSCRKCPEVAETGD